MVTSYPPAADDYDAYIFVDHRDHDELVIGLVSERLAAEDVLTPRRVDDEVLFVKFRGREHRIPLTNSYHDRYVTISSLAELLKEHYRFFLVGTFFESDSHGLLVAPLSQVRAWAALPEYLRELQLGYNYFSGMLVPYLNHEDSAPDFERDNLRFRATVDAQETFIRRALLEKKVDAGICAGFAKLVTPDPRMREEAGLSPTASEAELSSVFYTVLCAVLEDPDQEKAFGDFHAAIRKIESLTGGRWPVPGDG